MAIVINEFEVVPPGPAADAAPPKPGDKDASPKLDKRELFTLLRQHAERAARGRAH